MIDDPEITSQANPPLYMRQSDVRAFMEGLPMRTTQIFYVGVCFDGDTSTWRCPHMHSMEAAAEQCAYDHLVEVCSPSDPALRYSIGPSIPKSFGVGHHKVLSPRDPKPSFNARDRAEREHTAHVLAQRDARRRTGIE